MIINLKDKHDKVVAYMVWTKVNYLGCFSPTMSEIELDHAYVEKVWVHESLRQKSMEILKEFMIRESINNPHVNFAYFDRTKDKTVTHKVHKYTMKQLLRMLSKGGIHGIRRTPSKCPC